MVCDGIQAAVSHGVWSRYPFKKSYRFDAVAFHLKKSGSSVVLQSDGDYNAVPLYLPVLILERSIGLAHVNEHVNDAV